MKFFEDDLNAFFQAIQKNNRERTLEAPPPGSVDLCSNDYLCLSRDPRLAEALKEGIDRFGAGSTASRLVRGHRDIFAELETEYARWVGSEAALLFANGYAANVGCLSAICDASYDIFIDRLAHASLVDGVRLSGARKVYFHHNDMNHLETLLKKSSAKKKVIVTESLFSMDGDTAPLNAIAALKEKYGALLYVDDAHAIGVWGDQGKGLADASADFRMATFGKALGLEGAMIATSAANRKYLVHNARTFVFSTAPLPAIAHAGLTAIQIVRGMDKARLHIAALAAELRAKAAAAGRSTGNSTSHIVPVFCEDESEALTLAVKMLEAGFHVKAIRPPTVKESRLRFSLNCSVNEAMVTQIGSVLGRDD